MKLLLRKSAIAFILLVAAGIAGPFVLPLSPYAITGAPFARPVWWKTATLS